MLCFIKVATGAGWSHLSYHLFLLLLISYQAVACDTRRRSLQLARLDWLGLFFQLLGCLSCESINTLYAEKERLFIKDTIFRNANTAVDRNTKAGSAVLMDGNVKSSSLRMIIFWYIITSVDCVMGDWSSWSPCSQTCGGGFSTRSRNVTRQPTQNGIPCGKRNESKDCNTRSCPGEN